MPKEIPLNESRKLADELIRYINDKLSYDYDIESDSLFVCRIDSYDYGVFLEIDNDLILDFDNGGRLVAFEFLNASELLNENIK